jgi:hypothetical protein
VGVRRIGQLEPEHGFRRRSFTSVVSGEREGRRDARFMRAGVQWTGHAPPGSAFVRRMTARSVAATETSVQRPEELAAASIKLPQSGPIAPISPPAFRPDHANHRPQRPARD